VVEVHVVRVFTDEAGRYGNPLGVVLDPAGLTGAQRQAVATRLGYSETVFVDDPEAARLQIFTPACELPFAGHPLVGVSWLLGQVSGRPLEVLRPALVTAPVPTFVAEEATWIRGSVADAPPWDHVRLDSPAEVDRLQPPDAGGPWQKAQVWAWADEPAGLIRARVFARAFGVVEDEACGSATLMLAAAVGRPVAVRHGLGSLVLARPAGPGLAEVGGRVVYDRAFVVEPAGV